MACGQIQGLVEAGPEQPLRPADLKGVDEVRRFCEADWREPPQSEVSLTLKLATWAGLRPSESSVPYSVNQARRDRPDRAASESLVSTSSNVPSTTKTSPFRSLTSAEPTLSHGRRPAQAQRLARRWSDFLVSQVAREAFVREDSRHRSPLAPMPPSDFTKGTAILQDGHTAPRFRSTRP
jgi:hypothetical protein